MKQVVTADMPVTDVVRANGERLVELMAIAIQDALIHGESLIRLKVTDGRMSFTVERAER